MNCIIIYIKDLMDIMGLKKTAAVSFAARIKTELGKDVKRPLTVFDLCAYFQIDVTQYKRWVEEQRGGRS